MFLLIILMRAGDRLDDEAEPTNPSLLIPSHYNFCWSLVNRLYSSTMDSLKLQEGLGGRSGDVVCGGGWTGVCGWWWLVVGSWWPVGRWLAGQMWGDVG